MTTLGDNHKISYKILQFFAFLLRITMIGNRASEWTFLKFFVVTSFVKVLVNIHLTHYLQNFCLHNSHLSDFVWIYFIQRFVNNNLRQNSQIFLRSSYYVEESLAFFCCNFLWRFGECRPNSESVTEAVTWWMDKWPTYPKTDRLLSRQEIE